MRNSEFEIHPFDQAFYIESLLKRTHSILNDAKSLNSFWMKRNYHCKNDNRILDLYENIILNSGAISRFFWPSSSDVYHKHRGEKLREVYHVSNSNILKNRDMRNHIEHFDEKLDDFLKEFSTWKVMKKYVGPLIFVNDNRTFFRAYFYDKDIFKIFNVEYEMEPIIAEIRRIHEILLWQQENGGRFN